MESVRYYEIDFDNDYGMCIIGLRQPTIEEAKEFCKEDMEKWGAKEVTFICETDHEIAISCYSMENEASFPIFGL